MNPFRRFVSFGLSFLLALGQPAEALAASYVFRQPSAAGTYPIPTISNNIVTTGTYYKIDGKTYSISWQGSGGLAPYVIEIVAGNLPAGCPKPVQSGSVLSSACVFTTEGTWGGIIAQLTDANGMVVRDNAPNIVVTAPPPALSAYSFPFSGSVGKAYIGTAKITGGRPPYTVSRSSGAIPPGTAFSAVNDGSGNWTATLSGTPTTIGSYSFDILVGDANGKSVTSSQLNVNISYGAVSLALRPSKVAGVYRGVVGQPIKDSGVLVSGGTPPVVLSIQSGGLPAGLALGQNGAVTGTPTTSGSFTNIRAKAVDGATTPTTATSAVFSFEIAKALNAFVLGGSDAYTVGKQIAPVSTATSGGTGPYTYALAGSLPPGLTFSNSQGKISGTPSRAGRYDGMAVTATDSDGYQSTSQPFAMSVTDPLKISGTAPDGTAGRSYSFQYTASGGTAPYSFSVGEGSLPFGLDLAEDGTLSGTPFIGGSSDGIVVRVIDSEGVSSETAPFSINIRDALAIASVPNKSATRGKPYDARVEATGGVQPYRFTTVTGSFASGLSMDGNGRITGTPTVTGDPGPVTVLATDAEGSTASADVSIPVVDPLSIAGTLPPGTVGQSYATSYSAAGGSPPYAYALTGGTLPPGLAFDGDAGTISGTPTSSGSWSGISVTATDIDGRTATSTPATLAVSGQLRIAGTPPRAATVGQNYSTTFAAMGGKAPYAFSVVAGTLPVGIVLDGTTGVLSGAPTTAATSEGIQVRVVDAEGRAATTASFGIVVSDVLTLAGTAPGTATVNSSYSAQFTAQGGRTPYAWTVGAGTLPPGLALGQTGAVSGTPTTPGTYSNIQVTAADADGRQASSAPFSIAVASSLAITGTPTPYATTGTAYDALFTAQGGYGAKTYSLAAGTLPQGIVLNANAGTLSGTPTTAGTASGLKVRVTDSVGTSADSSPFAIDVRVPVAIASVPSGTTAVGEAYSSSASATGGRAPYVWALTAGTLPPGLSLNTSSGTLSGTTTTPGTFAGLRLRATDADGRATTSSPFSIDVTSTLAISGSPSPNATVGVAYSATFGSTGGSGSKSFSVSAGTLPAGLILSGAGVLSGTPTAGGQSSGIVVRVTDAAGTTADTSPFSIDVRDGVAVVSLPTGTAAAGTAYNSSASANGGRAPYGWSVASGTLPPGLSLGGTSGALTGTPTTPGSFPGITLRAVDADGRSAVSSAFQIDVANTLVVSGSPSSTATVGTSYSATFSSSGGFGARSYDLASGTLPAGLALSSAGILSGTPTAQGIASGLVVRVTDAGGTKATTSPFSIDVRDPLAISALAPAPASVGQPYSVVPSASGGRPPLNWTLYAGSLPPGLSVVASSGAVAGTPTTPGNYDGLRLQAVDADGRLAVSPAFDIAVSSTLSIAGSPPGFATVDQYYSTTFTTSGGSGSKVFDIAAGTLPSGLSLSTDGILSGNPSTVGVATGLVVRATDGVGTTAQTSPFSIDVRSTPAIASVPAGTASVGQAYGSSATATGGRAPYGWSLVAGTLPAGLTLDAATGAVSGTPTTPGTASNLRLRAVDADGRSATSQLFDIAVASTLAIAGTPATTATVGAPYSATFTASGGYGTKVFSIGSGTLPAGISLASNGLLSGTPTTAGAATGLVVRVTDASGTTAGSATFSIDVRAAVAIAAITPAPASVGQPYSVTPSATGGRSPYAWTIASGTLPPGLSLDAASGSIAGTPTTPGSFTGLRVKAQDQDGRGATSAPFDIAVASTLAVSGAPAPTATVGTAYSTTFTATGGSGSKSFDLAGGTLPAGLSLSSSGILSGTPSSVGSSTGLVVRATDAAGTTASSSSFSIDVRAPIVVTSVPAGSAAVGQSYSSTPSATGGRPPFAWSLVAGTLPAGLSLDASNGTVTGTPTTPGTSSALRLRAADADGRSGLSDPFDIVVSSTLAVAGSPAPSATVGAAYSATFTATGGNGAKAFSLAAGTLPAGLTLSTAGLLSGTPTTAGSATGLVVRVTDASGTNADGSPFSIDVRAALSLAAPTATTGQVGTAYSSTAQVVGGRGPYAYTLTAGALPAGLTLNAASGLVSGTPTAAGTATGLRISVSDADARSATTPAFQIAVSSNIAIAGTPPSSATVGSPYSATFTTTGGSGTKTFVLAAGTLPAGLTLSSGGVLSGTPSAVGNSTGLIVRVTDASGSTADSSPFSITVKAAMTVSMPTRVYQPVGSTFNIVPTVTGGTAPMTAALLTAGSPLPPGLSFNTTSGVISGTSTMATSGPRTFRVQFTDADGVVAVSDFSYIYAYTPLAITNAPPSTVSVYRQPSSTFYFAVTGNGLSPYVFSIDTGTLPPGMTLDTSSGAITGLPTTAGTYSGIRAKVVSNDGYVGYSPTFAITVTPALAIAGTPAAQAPLGRSYSAQFTASGGVGAYTYALNSGTLPAGLSLSSGGLISGTPTTSGASTGLSVRVTDGDGYGSTSATFSITIPQALAATFTPPPGTVGQAYSTSIATTGGVAPYTYAVLGTPPPNGLTLNTSTGSITGTPSGSGDTGGVYFKVTDASGSTVVTTSTTISVRSPVVPVAPSYKTRQNVAYSSKATANGGTAPFTFVLNGTLPAGLTFDASTATVSGTPTAAGTVSGLTLTATDSVGRTGSSPVYFETVAPITFGPVPTAAAVVNQPYSFQMTGSGGRGNRYWRVTNGTLPAPLVIDRNSGLITGTPTSTSSGFEIEIRASDDDGIDGIAPLFYLPVVNPLVANTTAPASATQDATYATGLVATGGRTPLTWSLVSGVLPSGLGLSGSSISGTPTVAGTASNIAYRVTDADGRTATTNAFSITVAPAALTASYAPPTYWPETPGSAYFPNTAATVSNYYRGTLTWTLGSGSLPPGLTLASNGSMSGSLTTAGSYTATLRATDSDGRTGTTSSFTIVVTTTFTISYSMPTAVVNRPYSAPAPTVSGGRPPYAYSVSSNAGGTLATGLTINASTGVVSGTPTDTGNPKNLVLNVTDADGRGKGVPINPVVNPAFQANNPGNAFKPVNQAFTWQVGAYGGIGPYTYSTGTGSLPPGMSMNTAGTISGTPTTKGAYTIAVNVKDSQNYTLSTGNFTLTIQ